MKTYIKSTYTSGYGHREIVIVYINNKEYKAITNNMPLYDEYKREIFTKKDERVQKYAKRALIRMVKDANGLR